MKTPINPLHIRRHDLIRVEQEAEKAHEYRATENAQRDGWGHYFLLERPATPPLELPSVPTLGWASANFDTRLIATTGDGHGGTDINDGGYVDSKYITAFTPAVAVPASALDELRLYVTGLDDLPILRSAERAAARFLAAVDAANGDAS